MNIFCVRATLSKAVQEAESMGCDWRWLEKQLREVEIERKFRKKSEPTPVGEAQHFEAFWQAYPRKTNKAGCQRSWVARDLDAEAVAILAHVTRMADSHDWTKEDGKYRPMPATYLNQRRWEGDEVDADPFGLEGAL